MDVSEWSTNTGCVKGGGGGGEYSARNLRGASNGPELDKETTPGIVC